MSKNVGYFFIYNLEHLKPIFVIFGTQYPENPSF